MALGLQFTLSCSKLIHTVCQIMQVPLDRRVSAEVSGELIHFPSLKIILYQQSLLGPDYKAPGTHVGRGMLATMGEAGAESDVLPHIL